MEDIAIGGGRWEGGTEHINIRTTFLGKNKWSGKRLNSVKADFLEVSIVGLDRAFLSALLECSF